MVLEEALKLADEAEKEGYLNPYPTACVGLAKEVKRLQRALKKAIRKQPSTVAEYLLNEGETNA